MLDWLRSLRDVITSSLKDSRMPFPMDTSICYKWREGLTFDDDKSRVIYTSCMYQLAPIISKAVEQLERFSVTKSSTMAALARLGVKLFGRTLLMPEPDEVERANKVLRSVYNALKASNVMFGVLEDEPYSGALLYELGFIDEFKEYANQVYELFKRSGVREIITVDPHTHYVLDKIYPKYVKDFDIKVTSYLDLINPGKVKVKLQEFTIHDSCLYARYLNKYDIIRSLFKDKATIKEDSVLTGKDTSHCCGGPIESTYPELAGKVAANRVRELTRLSRNIIVQCPICYVNLKRGAKLSGLEVNLYDLAEIMEVSS